MGRMQQEGGDAGAEVLGQELGQELTGMGVVLGEKRRMM